jgi:hypothetical protein
MKKRSDGLRHLVEDVRQKQNNILPHDFISHDRDVDDVLWHGPSRGSGIQRAGAFVIGLTLLVGSLSLGSETYEHQAWLGIVPTVAIFWAGIRVVYKSLRGRNPPKD